MDEILTLQEVANILRVNRATVWRWVQQGKVKGFRLGRGWRVDRIEVERLIGRELPARERSVVNPR